jgi:hypothetical protein
MANSLVQAPGSNLNEFVKNISYDLKRRKIEYSIVGFFNSNGQPMGMIETRGRTSWVEINITQIIDMARKINASGICLIHNHPRGIKESPDLKASIADISSLRTFITELDGTGLQYLGDWIVSNGHIVETLHTIQSRKNPEVGSSVFSDEEVATLLTPNLADAIQELTKTALLQIDFYSIFEKYLFKNKVEFKIKCFKYWGQNAEAWVFNINTEDSEGVISAAAMSIEQAIKAHDAIIELQSVSDKLSSVEVEYTEVKIELCDNVNCGFYQTGTKQGAFLYIGSNQMFVKVSELSCISDFVVAGLEKIDLIINHSS